MLSRWFDSFDNLVYVLRYSTILRERTHVNYVQLSRITEHRKYQKHYLNPSSEAYNFIFF